MTRIPRPLPPIWLRILVGVLLMAGIIGLSAVNMANDPPKPRCMGSDAANAWCSQVPNE